MEASPKSSKLDIFFSIETFFFGDPRFPWFLRHGGVDTCCPSHNGNSLPGIFPNQILELRLTQVIRQAILPY